MKERENSVDPESEVRKLRHSVHNHLTILGSFLVSCQQVAVFQKDDPMKRLLHDAEQSYREILASIDQYFRVSGESRV